MRAVKTAVIFLIWSGVALMIFAVIAAHILLALVDVPLHFLHRVVAPKGIFKAWSWNHLLSWSQKFNVWHGGDPDETFSSRVGKAMSLPNPGIYWRIFNRFLNLFEDDHALKSVERDEGKDQIRSHE